MPDDMSAFDVPMMAATKKKKKEASAPRAAIIPGKYWSASDFIMNGSGLYAIADGERLWVSAPFEVLANAADGADEHALIIAWRTARGERVIQRIPRAELHDKSIIRTLEARGLRVTTASSKDRFLMALAMAKCSRFVETPSQTGWVEVPKVGRAFIMPDGEVLPAAMKEKVIYRLRIDSNLPEQRAGTLEAWRALTPIIIANPRLALAVGAAMSGAVLHIVGAPTGGVHFHGITQSGKTTAARLAVSVWGRPDKQGMLKSWRTTDNALEALAEASSGAVLALDELAEAAPEIVAISVYMLANELGKARLSRSIEQRAPKTWRTALISSGELTVAEKIAQSRHNAKAPLGLGSRLLDIPSEAGSGLGIFNDLCGRASGAVLARDIAAIIQANHGVLGAALVEALAGDDWEEVKAGFAAVRAELTKQALAAVNAPPSMGQLGTICERFALAAFVLGYAAERGLFGPDTDPKPLRRHMLMLAIEHLRKDAVFGEGGGAASLEGRLGEKYLREFIERFGGSRFDTLINEGGLGYAARYKSTEQRCQNRAGWRLLKEGGEVEAYLFTASAMGEALGGLPVEGSVKALMQAGILKPGDGGKPQKKVRLPDVARVRVYWIEFPDSAKAANQG